MHSNLRSICFLAATLLSTAVAQASPVTWFIGGELTDGATFSGGFVYDADANNYSDIDVITTLGDIPGQHYTALDSSYLPVPDLVIFGNGIARFGLTFDSALTNFGGSKSFLKALSLEELPPTIRHTNGGEALAIGTAVPEPATALLVPAALLAGAWFRRKRIS